MALQFQLGKLGLLLGSVLFGRVIQAERPVCVRIYVLAGKVVDDIGW